MVRRLIRNQLPGNRLRVRVPCPPLEWKPLLRNGFCRFLHGYRQPSTGLPKGRITTKKHHIGTALFLVTHQLLRHHRSHKRIPTETEAPTEIVGTGSTEPPERQALVIFASSPGQIDAQPLHVPNQHAHQRRQEERIGAAKVRAAFIGKILDRIRGGSYRIVILEAIGISAMPIAAVTQSHRA